MGDKKIDYDYFKSRLYRFKDSANEFKKSKRDGIIGIVAMSASCVTLIIGIDSKQPSPKILFVSLGCFIVEITEVILAEHHFNKSIKLYNREVCNNRI